MPAYTNIQKEETLKGLVYEDYFSEFGYEPNIDNIDFVITNPKTRSDLFSVETPGASVHFLWAEAKKGAHDVFDMFTQLLLTCKKTYEKAEHLAPPWLGCFDEARISFAAFHDVLPIFTETDFNWTQTPSNHDTVDFQKSREKIKNLIGAKIVTYNFGADDGEIKEFIKTHFTANANASIKSPITKDNFVQIFIKWVKEVKPTINIAKETWSEFKKDGVLDCDFYRADIMSSGGNTITEKLKIVLKNDNYKFQVNLSGMLFSSDIGFTDSGEAYNRFWNRYERPPAPVYQQHIIDRRDLLVPQNIREVKGSFFTPKIWADKSKEYLAAVFGDNWQEEYYIWDCAAGTGNLLAGLKNEYNIWASDVDAGNVETMQSLIEIDENLNLLPAHVFQFDFLNDSFDKLPEELREIIRDPKKQEKLIIYINPPYAEATSTATMFGTKENKTGVAIQHKTSGRFQAMIGKASNELFTQFMARIQTEILQCGKLAQFSKLKYVNAPNFVKFREFFKATFKAGFVVPADTFDNVHGQFPIGFLIWDMAEKKDITSVKCDVIEQNGNKIETKNFYAHSGNKTINDWYRQFYDSSNTIGILHILGADFQHNNLLHISLEKNNSHYVFASITKKNIIPSSVYFSVRHCIEATWLNDRDQFLFPNDNWKDNIEFQNDCLIFTLFHGQNRISSTQGINHWIPFSEKEVGAKEKFKSNVMNAFLKDKIFSAEAGASKEALAVLDAGQELWKYYHAKIKTNNTASVNASFYDIREFFQGRNDAGKMNNKSEDETYNTLIKALRETLNTLAKKIEPKVYEFEFLLE